MNDLTDHTFTLLTLKKVLLKYWKQVVNIYSIIINNIYLIIFVLKYIYTHYKN